MIDLLENNDPLETILVLFGKLPFASFPPFSFAWYLI
jgi:hypothetical protein